MERKYQRQYENFSGVVPRAEDFPVLGGENNAPDTQSIPKDTSPAHIQSANSFLSGLKTDDILLVVILILMLTEEKKDMPTIIALAVLLLSEYF